MVFYSLGLQKAGNLSSVLFCRIMIFKYALFTLTVSIIPVFIIIKDLETTLQLTNLISSSISKINLDLLQSILSSGLVTYFSSSEDVEKDIDCHVQSTFTKEVLKTFTGKNNKPIYLSILGNIFDVSKAKKYYGPGENYNVFTGRDGSRAFVTGDFTEAGLIDDVLDLTLSELRSLKDWLQFYQKEYVYKGKLIGRYYNKNGQPTGYNHKLQIKLEEAAKDENERNKDKLMYPPCNVEWTQEEGSRVWCSERSGGIERAWVGVPRKLYEPGAATFRCACINLSGQSQVIVPETGKPRSRNLEEYEDCHPKSTSCFVHE